MGEVMLVIEVHSDIESIQVQEIAFSCGYSWGSENLKTPRNTSGRLLVFRPHNKNISYANDTYSSLYDFKERIGVDVSGMRQIYFDNHLKDNLNGVKYIDYNKPKILIYESKILKYNDFKKC